MAIKQLQDNSSETKSINLEDISKNSSSQNSWLNSSRNNKEKWINIDRKLKMLENKFKGKY